ncbi:MAG: hypothetical protein AB2810_17900 [Candidatus Thiodiazotropha endolucinida]
MGDENSGNKGWPTPFPALLYCFATIDLFASFYMGRMRNNTNNMKSYLTNLMGYDEQLTDNLVGIFRHKLVHTAQPKTFYKNADGQIYTWAYVHCNREKHLTIQKHTDPEEAHTLWLSIIDFAEDIVNSIRDPHKGYLHKLGKDAQLQLNVSKVLTELYGV